MAERLPLAQIQSDHQPSSVLRSLESLFARFFGGKPEKVEALPGAGSPRKYFRLGNTQDSVIGTWNQNLAENETFFYLAAHFGRAGLPVPRVHIVSDDRRAYLQQDLGDQSLLDHLQTYREESRPAEETLNLYRQSLEKLAEIQTTGSRDLDFQRCWSGAIFDAQAMHWDLQYFKYYFLRPQGIDFDDYALERDFTALSAFLSQVPTDFFLYRDFQARNIMIHRGEPWMIDFQGGRQGPLAYDLASLLFQARAGLDADLRSELFEHYLEALTRRIKLDTRAFRATYPGFVLLRLLQVLGAYGFRGWFERKPHFLLSIDPALKHVQSHLQSMSGDQPHLPALRKVLEACMEIQQKKNEGSSPAAGRLRVRIQSFSYRRGLPDDPAGNGGGFVFDCRGIDNPGRQAAYKPLTGRDAAVIRYLEDKTGIREFVDQARSLVEVNIRSYLERGFSDLMVSFGCTGGQHRSVYCADRLARLLEQIPGLEVEVQHLEQERKGWKNA